MALKTLVDVRDLIQSDFVEQSWISWACNLAVLSLQRKDFAACSSNALSLGQREHGYPSY